MYKNGRLLVNNMFDFIELSYDNSKIATYIPLREKFSFLMLKMFLCDNFYTKVDLMDSLSMLSSQRTMKFKKVSLTIDLKAENFVKVINYLHKSRKFFKTLCIKLRYIRYDEQEINIEVPELPCKELKFEETAPQNAFEKKTIYLRNETRKLTLKNLNLFSLPDNEFAIRLLPAEMRPELSLMNDQSNNMAKQLRLDSIKMINCEMNERYMIKMLEFVDYKTISFEYKKIFKEILNEEEEMYILENTIPIKDSTKKISLCDFFVRDLTDIQFFSHTTSAKIVNLDEIMYVTESTNYLSIKPHLTFQFCDKPFFVKKFVIDSDINNITFVFNQETNIETIELYNACFERNLFFLPVVSDCYINTIKCNLECKKFEISNDLLSFYNKMVFVSKLLLLMKSRDQHLLHFENITIENISVEVAQECKKIAIETQRLKTNKFEIKVLNDLVLTLSKDVIENEVKFSFQKNLSYQTVANLPSKIFVTIENSQNDNRLLMLLFVGDKEVEFDTKYLKTIDINMLSKLNHSEICKIANIETKSYDNESDSEFEELDEVDEVDELDEIEKVILNNVDNDEFFDPFFDHY